MGGEPEGGARGKRCAARGSPPSLTFGDPLTYSPHRAQFESALASSHRALYRALAAAEALNSPGDVEDISEILREITRITDASLSDRRRPLKPMQGQIKLVEVPEVS